METTKIFYSGDIIKCDKATLQCICADGFVAIFGQVEGEHGAPKGERGCSVSYETLIALSNEGTAENLDTSLIKSVEEVSMKGFRSREPKKEEFEYQIVFRNSFAYDEGAYLLTAHTK